jgi:hypothetical protein
VPTLLVAYDLTKYCVLAVSPDILLVKIPFPLPSVVFVVSAIVGFCVVLQTTPLAVTVAPPSDVILPPEILVVDVIAEIIAVVITGAVIGIGIEILISFV